MREKLSCGHCKIEFYRPTARYGIGAQEVFAD